MAYFAAILVFIILTGFNNVSAANKDPCDISAAVGQNLTLPFVYQLLEKSNVLRWTHNSSIIFYRQQGKVSVGKSEDISATGSFFLRNVQYSSAGIYQANVLHNNGTPAISWTGHLCIMDKVPKPQVTYTCDSKSNTVNLNCLVNRPQGLLFSWTLNEKTLTSETRQTLSISLAQLKGDRSFTCSVANKISKEKSATVRPNCSPPQPTMYCFTSRTFLAMLVGGIGLILVLLIIIIILCCRHRSIRDKGSLRMLSVRKQELDSSPDYETMHQSEEFPPTLPSSSPRTCYEMVPQPETQTENMPVPLSTNADGLQPSPVPKPRTKSPQTPRN